MTIIVTGTAGFIDSNIIKALNQRGITDIVAVNSLSKGEKFEDLTEYEIAHYFDKHESIHQIRSHLLPYEGIKVVFHQGARSDTMNHDSLYMMDNSYQYALDFLDWCQDERISFPYVSSAAVYGKNEVFRGERELEKPLNVYGYSEFLLDQVLRRHVKKDPAAQIVGPRYFDVYGQQEQHKGHMVSVAFHHSHQYREHSYVNLFDANDGYGNSEQIRDFVSIEDVTKVSLYFFDYPGLLDVFNLGTGRGQQFNELATAAVNACHAAEGKPEMSLKELIEKKLIHYIPFPNALKDGYQSFTQMGITKLREAGYTEEFLDVKQDTNHYVKWMLGNLV